MIYEEFKLTKKNKLNLARRIKSAMKEEFKHNETFECSVMYNVETDEFTIFPTYLEDRMEYEGYCKYKVFTHSMVDGNLTLNQIIEKVFKYY